MKVKRVVKAHWFLLSTIFLINVNASAQKLPNKQVENLRATFDVKSMGNAMQSENEFKAYNRATNLFYTIANDDDNLFIILRATDPMIIRKILYGNISVTFGLPKSKPDEKIKITFPLLDIKDQGIFGQFKSQEDMQLNGTEV